MAKSANLYARIEPDIKEQAETILSALGIPADTAVIDYPGDKTGAVKGGRW